MKHVYVLFGFLSLLIAGCNGNETVIEEQEKEIKQLHEHITEIEADLQEQEQIIDNHSEDFSYLNDLSDQDKEAYELFVEEKDDRHLSGLSPDKMMLVYYHSVVQDDIEALYSLAYNDGTLPDFKVFKQQYEDHLHKKELKTALSFRDYDDIRVREGQTKENEAHVEMHVSYGGYSQVIVASFSNDNGVWKKDVLHLLESLEEQA
ncbi:hypothetical protein EQV77_06350 [Halobacillus fulvus]|nr:hypothetical protein EQV77_06350 [Halobacillus fulvus]